MKRFLAGVLSALLLGAAAVGFAGCGDDDRSRAPKHYDVYAPDGATALALVNAIAQEKEGYTYHVVDSSTIQSYVTGNAPAADFCVLPLNAASKLLGTGETYQMLGTVTNGNLYFLTTGSNAAITDENLSTLVGKTVGVVQLANVPGLALQVALKNHNVEYTIIGNDGATQSDRVNLKAVDGADVTPASPYDYFLFPEPAASTKVTATASAPKPFVAAGSLQALYEGGGFPQAVLVAKKSVIQNDPASVTEFITFMDGSAEYLKTVQPATVLELLNDKRTEGLTPSFNAKNLTAQVLANCSVKFTASKDCKETVNAFLAQLIAVNANAAKTVETAFFYEG
ncbi:MAG: hypothetical protein K2N74_01120 [Clostridiales bacterium]|nr:hypothetical protein [Clostridiales bacterium]